MLPVTNYCEIHKEYHFCNGATPMTTNNPLDRFEQQVRNMTVTQDGRGLPPAAAAFIRSIAVELVNSELTDFWTSLTPDENIMRAAENYQKFCDRIDALMTTSNSQPCPRCNGTGKNPDNSVLGWPGKPCYICHGTGKAPSEDAPTD